MRILLLTIYLLLSVSKSFGAVQTTSSKALRHARIGVAIESQDKKSKINSLCSSSSVEKMDIDEDDDLDAQEQYFSKSSQPFRSTSKTGLHLVCHLRLAQQVGAKAICVQIPYWQTANERLAPNAIYILNEVIRI